MSQLDSTPPTEESLPTTTDTAPSTGAHAVSDSYVARRMEEHAAAVAAAEQRESAAWSSGEPQSALAFYVLLGFVLSVLLLIVILRTSGPTGEPQPTPSPGAVTSPR